MGSEGERAAAALRSTQEETTRWRSGRLTAPCATKIVDGSLSLVLAASRGGGGHGSVRATGRAAVAANTALGVEGEMREHGGRCKREGEGCGRDGG